MITSNSRYAKSTVVTGTNLDGNDILVVLFSQPTDVSFKFKYHQVTNNDHVDVLAYNYFSDPRLWWLIANANPEITNWSRLVPGSLLRIPTLTSVVI
jgi:hypothetical protein